MFNYPRKIPHTEYSFSKQTSPQLPWSLKKKKNRKCRDFFHYLNKRGYKTSFPISEGTPKNTKPSLIPHIHTNPEHCLAHPWSPVHPKHSRFISQWFLPVSSAEHAFSRSAFAQDQPHWAHVPGAEHQSHGHQAALSSPGQARTVWLISHCKGERIQTLPSAWDTTTTG